MATGPLQDKERQVKSSAHGQSKHQGGQRECSHVEGQGSRKGKASSSGLGDVQRLTKEHSFLTDVADVRAMEQGLLQLLADFHSGKLRAFSDSATFEKMDQIREQQERLARQHFELDVHQDLHRLGTEEARTTANDNLSKLVEQLHQLSASIQTLQTGASDKDDKKLVRLNHEVSAWNLLLWELRHKETKIIFKRALKIYFHQEEQQQSLLLLFVNSLYLCFSFTVIFICYILSFCM